MSLIQGIDGSLKVGPAGTEDTVGYITEWEANPKTEIKKNGPFVGNANVAKVRAGKDCTGSMKGFVPVGRDVGQSAIITAHENGEDIRFVGQADDGYVLTIPQTIISGLKFGAKSDEGIPFECEFEANNGYTLAPVTP